MQYAVVTGGTQGIGKAIAEKLLAQGVSLAICSRNTAKLKLLEEEWQNKYTSLSVLCYTADLSKKEEVEGFANAVLAKFPTIDLLINNAGKFTPGTIAKEPENLLEELFNVNVLSAYNLTRKLLPKMIKRGAGHIFNMCSVASLQAYTNGGAYSITKYALKGFSDNLREELKPFNIKVTSLCPGATYTPSWEDIDINPERIMEANDIANMLWSAYNLSTQANVETIIMRPVKGDL